MSAESHKLTPTARLHEVTMAALSRSRVPVFGITDERGPGGIVIPLFRCEVPVCEHFPEPDLAFYATLAYYAQFRAQHPVPNGG